MCVFVLKNFVEKVVTRCVSYRERGELNDRDALERDNYVIYVLIERLTCPCGDSQNIIILKASD